MRSLCPIGSNDFTNTSFFKVSYEEEGGGEAYKEETCWTRASDRPHNGTEQYVSVINK